MAEVCSNCGTKLGFGQKLLGKTLCSGCSKAADQARTLAEREYRSAVQAMISAGEPSPDWDNTRVRLVREARLTPDKLRSIHLSSLRACLENALADDHLTEQEERQLTSVASALGIDQAVFQESFKDLMPRLFIARVNDGRIPTLLETRILMKKGEIAHIEADADLLKEVVHKEYRGGYQGVSFRVAKGVRFHTGGSRGKMVVVGTSLETVDQGILTITSQRSVFTGARQSIEMPHPKLLTLNLFADGVQFHLSNRKNPPLFRLQAGMSELIAATVNAASQQI